MLSPIPAKSGATQKEYQEYVCKGVCNVLLVYNIDTGQRYPQVTMTKTQADYARFMDWVVATRYPETPLVKAGAGQLQHVYLRGLLWMSAR